MNQQTTSAGEDGEKGNPFALLIEIANWCSHYGKQYEVSLNIKNRTTI